ncbi:MAG: tetratricopeptide repeat protein [Chloroflexota bacterium]
MRLFWQIFGGTVALVGFLWAVDSWLSPRPLINPWMAGLYRDAVQTVGWEFPPTLALIVLFALVIGLVSAVASLLLPHRRDITQAGVKLAVQEATAPLQTAVTGIAEYLDGLPTAADKVLRDFFERGRAEKEKCQWRQAIPLFEECLRHATEASQQVALHILLGNCHYNLGQLGEAQKEHEGALTAAVAMTDPRERDLASGAALGNMGLIYAGKGEPDKALEQHQKAYEIHEKLGNPLGMANQLGNMGLIYADKGEPDKALEHTERALAIFERIGARPQAEKALRILEGLRKPKPKKGRR